MVVAGPIGRAWLGAGEQVSKKLGLPLGLQMLSSADPGDGFQVGLRGAVLVADGHVACRMPWLPTDPAQELAGALTTVLPGAAGTALTAAPGGTPSAREDERAVLLLRARPLGEPGQAKRAAAAWSSMATPRTS